MLSAMVLLPGINDMINMCFLIAWLNVILILLNRSVLYSLVLITLVFYATKKHRVDAVLIVTWFTCLALWYVGLVTGVRNMINYSQFLVTLSSIALVGRRLGNVP